MIPGGCAPPDARHAGSRALDLACLAGLLAYALVFVSLTSGGFADADDRHYLEAADAWRTQPPFLGTTHWHLRLPLVLAMAASMAVGGRTEAAGFAVPAMACALLLVAATFLLLRPAAGRAAAVLAGVLTVSAPVVAIYGRDFGPDGLEAALCAGSFTVFVRSWTRRPVPMAAAGLLLGVCWVDRATCAPLLLLYGLLFLRAGPARWRFLPLFAGFAAPVLAEAAFYAMDAGTPFYRLPIDAASLEIPSQHMIGQVAHGLRPPFNWHLMALWRPNSAVDVHWAVNPFIDLLSNPQHGWLIAPGILVGALLWRSTPPQSGLGWLVRALCVWAVLILFVVLAVLNLRPQPRYFLTLTWIAGVLVALWAAPLLQGRWRLPASLAVAGVLALDLLAAQFRPDPISADRAMAWHLRTAPGAVWTTPEHRGTLLLLDASLAPRVLPLPAPPGGPVFLTTVEAAAPAYAPWPVQWRGGEPVPLPLGLFQPLAAAVGRDLRTRESGAVVVAAPG